MLFSIDLKYAYLHITYMSIVKHHHHCYGLFGNANLFSGQFYYLGFLQPLGFPFIY